MGSLTCQLAPPPQPGSGTPNLRRVDSEAELDWFRWPSGLTHGKMIDGSSAGCCCFLLGWANEKLMPTPSRLNALTSEESPKWVALLSVVIQNTQKAGADRKVKCTRPT